MSIALGNNFSARWQATPLIIRQQIFSELESINNLLDTELSFADWLVQQNNAELQPSMVEARILEIKQQFLREADQLIEQALAPIKAELKHWLYAEVDFLSRSASLSASHADENTAPPTIQLPL